MNSYIFQEVMNDKEAKGDNFTACQLMDDAECNGDLFTVGQLMNEADNNGSKKMTSKIYNKWCGLSVAAFSTIIIIVIGYCVTNTPRKKEPEPILKVDWGIEKLESKQDIFQQKLNTDKSETKRYKSNQWLNRVYRAMANMDKEKDPCDDFWLRSCGGYITSHRYLKSIHYKREINVKAEMKRATDEEVIGLLEEPTTESTIEPVKMVKKLYSSCLKQVTIQKTMKQFLINISLQLGGVPLITGHTYSHDQVTALRALLRETGELLWIQYYIVDDPNYSRKIIKLRLKTNCNLDVLSDFVATMQLLFSGDFRLDKILNFCERVSQMTHSAELSMDDVFHSEVFNETEIMKYFPGFDLVNIFRDIVAISPDNINDFYFMIDDISNLKKFTELVLETNTSEFMNIAFLEMFDNFYGLVPIVEKYFADTISSNGRTNTFVNSNLPSIPPQKHTCLDVAYLASDVLEWMYTEKYLDAQVREEAYYITKYLMKAMEKVLSEIKWLNNETRKSGNEKIEKMSRSIFIRSKNSDYLKYELIGSYANIRLTENFFTNTIRLKKKRLELQTLAMLKNIIFVTDMNIKAVYNILYNSIHIPIASMQPPLFYKGAPMAVNFGGLGTVIGHEILNAFDVDSSSFNINTKWLSDDCLDKYNELKEDMENIYSEYKVEIMNYTVDGAKTVKENIADIGGLKIAYEAYLLWKLDHPGADITQPILDMTDLQLFFTAFAQSWCSTENPEDKEYYLNHAVHAPMEARVQVPLQNSKDFAEAFRCQKDSKMNPQHKSKMWNN